MLELSGMKRFVLLVGVVAVIIGAGWGVQAWNSFQRNASTAKFNDDVDNLFYALQQYKEHIGSYPVGSNSEIVQALMGKNPKNMLILVGRKREVNSKGEIVDPWGTPLRIYFAGEGILVRSAGPNKRFDDSTMLTSDDYFRSN
jgi:hypothetical protein